MTVASIGIIGGGQLGSMLSEAAKKLNIKEIKLNKILKDLEKDGVIYIAKNKYIEIQSK